MSSKRIDPKVQELIKAINSFPGIQTLMSCGGHKKPKFTHSQVPENEFFVDFSFKTSYPTKEAWQSLNEIARSISENVVYQWTGISDKGVKIEIQKSDSYIIYFTLYGRDVDPDDLAVDILARQPENFNLLKPKTPVNYNLLPKIKS